MNKKVIAYVMKHKDNPPSHVIVNGRRVPWHRVAPLVLGEKDLADKDNKDEVEHDLEQTDYESEDQDHGSRDSQGEE